MKLRGGEWEEEVGEEVEGWDGADVLVSLLVDVELNRTAEDCDRGMNECGEAYDWQRRTVIVRKQRDIARRLMAV